MPVGCKRVRTGGGPPGRSLAREKAAQGGAAAATPIRPDEHKRCRFWNVRSSRRSTGASLARPNSATAWETGEDAPANRSRKRRLPVGTGVDTVSDASPTAVQEDRWGGEDTVAQGRAGTTSADSLACTTGGAGATAGGSGTGVPTGSNGGRGGDPSRCESTVQWGVLPCSKAVCGCPQALPLGRGTGQP